jgi:hypothetical protein
VDTPTTYDEAPACAECGETAEDATRCSAGYCETLGCSCAVERVDLCFREPLDGSWVCQEHMPSHRGCPDCDPVMPWEE